MNPNKFHLFSQERASNNSSFKAKKHSPYRHIPSLYDSQLKYIKSFRDENSLINYININNAPNLHFFIHMKNDERIKYDMMIFLLENNNISLLCEYVNIRKKRIKYLLNIKKCIKG